MWAKVLRNAVPLGLLFPLPALLPTSSYHVPPCPIMPHAAPCHTNVSMTRHTTYHMRHTTPHYTTSQDVTEGPFFTGRLLWMCQDSAEAVCPDWPWARPGMAVCVLHSTSLSPGSAHILFSYLILGLQLDSHFTKYQNKSYSGTNSSILKSLKRLPRTRWVLPSLSWVLFQCLAWRRSQKIDLCINK